MFFESLKLRNEALFYFGILCFLLALIFFILSRTTTTEVLGINAWIKPVKFSLSLAIFSWTMAWYTHYLGPSTGITLYSWGIIVFLGFEIVYIAYQAGKGQLSHFNVNTPFHSFMYSMMAIAATIVTIWTAYIGMRFFQGEFPALPDYYLWAIRLGIILFVVFSFEGFVMGSRLSHTIGGPDGGNGLPFLNWSKTFGDPRIAHFIGMHALQVLPILAYYLFKNVQLTVGFAVLYGLLAVLTLIQALNGLPYHKVSGN